MGIGGWLLAHAPCFLLSAPASCSLLPHASCPCSLFPAHAPFSRVIGEHVPCFRCLVSGCRFPLCAHAPCSMFTGRCLSSLVSRVSHLISIVSLVHDSIDGLLKQTSASPSSSFSTQSRRGWVWRPEETETAHKIRPCRGRSLLSCLLAHLPTTHLAAYLPAWLPYTVVVFSCWLVAAVCMLVCLLACSCASVRLGWARLGWGPTQWSQLSVERVSEHCI